MLRVEVCISVLVITRFDVIFTVIGEDLRNINELLGHETLFASRADVIEVANLNEIEPAGSFFMSNRYLSC